MQKVTLRFPNHDSLWLFKDRSRAINVMIAPRKNLITGPFSPEEVEAAVKELHAVKMDNAPATRVTSRGEITESRTSPTSYRFRFSQLLSLLNL